MKALFVVGIGLAAISSALVGSPAQAQDLLVNDFGDGLQSWRFDFGSPITPILSRDGNEGSPGNAQGALRMDMTYVSSQGGNNNFAFTGDVFFPAMDLSGFEELLFDLKIADGAALDAFGNHGFFQFVSREGDGYGFNSVLGENLAPETGVWKTFSVPTDTMTETRAFTVQLYGGPDQNIDGPITLFLDNIRLVPEPSTIALATLVAGLAATRRRKS
ncbi:MAG: PEP-CTERM sorting domain-containing protein [Planctomycetota bacterium]